MDPTESLRHIRSLVLGALEMDDIDMLRMHLKEILATANRGIMGNVVPHPRLFDWAGLAARPNMVSRPLPT
jgi:hypothetical protein